MIMFFLMLANHQIRHLATHRVICQHGDCRWPLNLLGRDVYRGYHSHFITPEGQCIVSLLVQLTDYNFHNFVILFT